MSAAPGWYPSQNGDQRYWDGTAWTEHYAPVEEPPPSLTPPMDKRIVRQAGMVVVLLLLCVVLVWIA
jgi:hypothetical protein